MKAASWVQFRSAVSGMGSLFGTANEVIEFPKTGIRDQLDGRGNTGTVFLGTTRIGLWSDWFPVCGRAEERHHETVSLDSVRCIRWRCGALWCLADRQPHLVGRGAACLRFRSQTAPVTEVAIAPTAKQLADKAMEASYGKS